MLLSRSAGFPLALAALLLLGSIAHAEDEYIGSGNPGHGQAGFRIELYDNPDDGDGNPFLDEELTVIEPAIVLDYDLTDRLGAHGQFAYDYVSSASMKRLSRYPEQSGASGDYYWGLDAGLDYELSERSRVGGFGSASIEYDYTSFGLGGNYSRDSEDHGSTWTITSNGFFDLVDVIRFNGQDEGGDHRLSFTNSLSWYQVIDRNTHGELGATLTVQNGFLESAFNAVVIEDPNLDPNPALANNARGYEITEELPDSRIRSTLHGQIRRSLGESNALGLHGRLYSDNWGIQSLTVEPRYYRWLRPESLSLRLRYRFYSQSAADAYAESFQAVVDERTQDSDLAGLSSHGAGIRLEWLRGRDWAVDLTADYTLRSDGINSLFGGSGIRRSF